MGRKGPSVIIISALDNIAFKLRNKSMKIILIISLFLTNFTNAHGLEYRCFFKGYTQLEQKQALIVKYDNLICLEATIAEANQILQNAITARKEFIAKFGSYEIFYTEVPNKNGDVEFLSHEVLPYIQSVASEIRILEHCLANQESIHCDPSNHTIRFKYDNNLFKLNKLGHIEYLA